MTEEILTSVIERQNTHMSNVGGMIRRKMQYLINKQIIQNKITEGGRHSPVLLHGKGTMCRAVTHQDPIVE
jgi:hypothetical protein